MDEHSRRERFSQLLAQHESELLRTVLVYVPSRNDARDVVQDTAVALWKQFDRFDPSRPFVKWACGFARIEVRRYLRQARKRLLLSERAAEVLAVSESRVTEQSEARGRALQCCLERLQPSQRELIRGFYVEERPATILATQQGRTVDAVYKSLERIRRSLHDGIQRELAKTNSGL